jgi:hypothetical protein
MSNRLYFGDNLEWLRDRREALAARIFPAQKSSTPPS